MIRQGHGPALILCAEHVRQPGGESPLLNLMEVLSSNRRVPTRMHGGVTGKVGESVCCRTRLRIDLIR